MCQSGSCLINKILFVMVSSTKISVAHTGSEEQSRITYFSARQSIVNHKLHRRH